MPTSYTSLLGLALPVQGELTGSWGDVVNNSITVLLDAAIAGTTTLSTDADVTLTTTTGAANQARQAVLACTGARTAQRTITAPAASKAYIVVNATSGGYAVKLVGAGPTTGVTIAANKQALVVWGGSDFVIVASTDVADSGATTIGKNLITLTNPSAVTFPRFNADNTVSALDAASFRSAIGAGTGNGDVVAASNNAFTGANTFYNATGQTIGTATAANDGIILVGRAGGTSSYRVTIAPTTLTASRAVTLPDAAGVVVLDGATQTLTAKTLTTPIVSGTPATTAGTRGYDATANVPTYYNGSAVMQVGYLNIPQNSKSTAYTLVLDDAGKHILHPSADTTARTFTIPANSSVAYPIGTAITFVNQNGAGVVTISITTDTMRLAGAGTTGSRTLAANGVATAVKITSTEWIISGTGLT
jgi:hypothetical protein